MCRYWYSKHHYAMEVLIEVVVDIGLELALPSRTPMHQYNVTKSQSRLDQVFLLEHTKHMLISCNMQTDLQGILTDYLLIVTVLDFQMEPTTNMLFANFREVDWEEFRLALETYLPGLLPPEWILNQHQLDSSCEVLMIAI